MLNKITHGKVAQEKLKRSLIEKSCLKFTSFVEENANEIIIDKLTSAEVEKNKKSFTAQLLKRVILALLLNKKRIP